MSATKPAGVSFDQEDVTDKPRDVRDDRSDVDDEAGGMGFNHEDVTDEPRCVGDSPDRVSSNRADVGDKAEEQGESRASTRLLGSHLALLPRGVAASPEYCNPSVSAVLRSP